MRVILETDYAGWQGANGGSRPAAPGISSPQRGQTKACTSFGTAGTYPVAIDNQKENWTVWANHMWPSVYLIDRHGYVRYWWYGELNWEGAQGEEYFRKKIGDLLAEQD